MYVLLKCSMLKKKKKCAYIYIYRYTYIYILLYLPTSPVLEKLRAVEAPIQSPITLPQLKKINFICTEVHSLLLLF